MLKSPLATLREAIPNSLIGFEKLLENRKAPINKITTIIAAILIMFFFKLLSRLFISSKNRLALKTPMTLPSTTIGIATYNISSFTDALYLNDVPRPSLIACIISILFLWFSINVGIFSESAKTTPSGFMIVSLVLICSPSFLMRVSSSSIWLFSKSGDIFRFNVKQRFFRLAVNVSM